MEQDKQQEKKKAGRPPKELNDFGRWIIESGQKREEIAKKLDTTEQYLGRLASGKQQPGRKLAIKIEELTGGVITVKFWDKQF